MKKIILSALVASSLVMAADIDFTQSNKLVTHTELGYISTDGNTETTTYSIDAKATKGFDKHLFTFVFDAQYAEDQDIETKNKFFTELQYDYLIMEKLAFNYTAGYKDDKFSGLNYQAYTGPGVKYKAITSDIHVLSLGLNALYSIDDVEDVKYDASGEIIAYPNPANTPTASTTLGDKETYTSMMATLNYEFQITESLKFIQDASYRADASDSDNYFVLSKTALSSKISDIFSAGISYKVDYVNLPAEGKDDTDTTFTATLSIDY